MEEYTLNNFLEEAGLSMTKVADDTGLSLALISLIKNEKIALSDKTVKVFEDTYNIRLIEANPLFIEKRKNQELEKEIQKHSEKEEKYLENCQLQINKDYYLKRILSLDISIFNDKNLRKLYSTLNKLIQEP